MTYPRLKLARTLLREDGVLFMNIGEEELSNSDKLLSYVFGEQNRVSIIARVVKTASNLGTHFAPSIDFLLCYARNFSSLPPFKDKVDETLYKKVEASGPRQGERYRDDVAFYQASQRDLRPNQKYPVECPDGSWAIPPCSIIDETMREGDGRWRWSKQTYYENKHLIVFKETKTSPLLDANGKQSRYNVYTKSYLKDRAEDGTTPRNLMTEFINRKGADLIKKFGIAFDFSKPVELMQYLQEITGVSDDDIVLDFYAGSCSTAHAVMNLNAVDAGHRRHIMVQLSEPCDDSSEAFKSGLRTIAEIGKERIRRTGAKIKEQSAITAPDLDVGFRVLKVDSSNMKDVYYAPDAITQADLLAHFDNIREDRTAEDLLFQVLVDWGVDLALPIAAESLAGKTVFFVDSNALAACFDADITEDLVKELAKRKPLRAVFRDSSYGSDSVKINVEQIFKLLSPGTEIKSL
jgi:adenine-specific DNA-methyltransferase